ncbi:hypothetical protein PDE_00356 [Penicillium oxalicum 114-2]|uniref:Uncharacterized protein n=1 Tax=Penicillium oxalicum (strain 114-2 / CGMCC 5302) TaxID=933388 RepID=S8AI79_PENO1|nr:hypothetical protein PDE_00356 [Penicillium oxalicum 114-2]
MDSQARIFAFDLCVVLQYNTQVIGRTQAHQPAPIPCLEWITEEIWFRNENTRQSAFSWLLNWTRKVIRKIGEKRTWSDRKPPKFWWNRGQRPFRESVTGPSEGKLEIFLSDDLIRSITISVRENSHTVEARHHHRDFAKLEKSCQMDNLIKAVM